MMKNVPRPPIELREVVTPDAIATTAALAHEVWHEFYSAILTTAQIDYMLAKYQSPAAIAAQLHEGTRYFLACAGREPAGYYATELLRGEAVLFISKLYLKARWRRHGIGGLMLTHICQLGAAAQAATLRLTVNKNNPTLAWYHRQGFHRAASVVSDIGGGFVMDDYIMERAVPQE